MRKGQHKFIFNTIVTNSPKPVSLTPVPKESAPEPVVVSATLAERFRRFFDHASFHTLFGLFGGFVGIFLDGRYSAILGFSLSWTLFRSKALEHLRPRVTISIHALVVAVFTALFYFIGIQLNHARVHTNTPADYLAAIRAGTPLPITQQITNVYNTYTQPPHVTAPQKTPPQDEPRIDFTGFTVDGYDQNGVTLVNTATNTGGKAAVKVRGTAYSDFLPQSVTSEEKLFSFIESHAFDNDAHAPDFPVGKEYSRIEPLRVDNLKEEQIDEYKGETKVRYFGRADSFSNGNSNWFISEICMYQAFKSTLLHYCSTHNETKKVAR